MKNINRIADPATGGGGAAKAPTVAELQAQLAAANAKIAVYEAKESERAAEEQQISAKVQAGLTRDQAIKVIQRQKDHDAAIAKQWAARRPQIVAILKEKLPDREMRLRVREIDASITLDEIAAAKATLK
jgi:hypothetical protein